jgi:hypothetical protein
MQPTFDKITTYVTFTVEKCSPKIRTTFVFEQLLKI